MGRCKGVAWSRCALAVLFALLAITSNLSADDWEELPHAAPPQTSPGPDAAPVSTGNPGTFIACGEPARPARDPVKGIVAQLDEMYGESFRAYESVAPEVPHAATGGCIFYNQTELKSLLGNWMGVRDANAVQPMLYAIFAHEFGHLEHGDVDARPSSREEARERELNADRFAGYTLGRLGLPRLDPEQVNNYYRAVGDDYVGAGDNGDHGTSAQRTTALEDGWHRADLGLPEAGSEPAGGLGQP
ncbi:MAG TPA: hypothetical protein VEJ86_09330 [Candidatus Binataceae bacterium]|nr:hypothetical protein [Candidatus Binataceae bacterium]